MDGLVLDGVAMPIIHGTQEGVGLLCKMLETLRSRLHERQLLGYFGESACRQGGGQAISHHTEEQIVRLPCLQFHNETVEVDTEKQLMDVPHLQFL